MIEVAPRRAIRAPLEIESYATRIGPAIWLYLELVSIAQHDGRAMCRLDRLAASFKASEEQIQAWLQMLHGAGLIEPTTPPPFLVIRLRFWPGRSSKVR